MIFQTIYQKIKTGALGKAKTIASNSISGVLNESLIRFRAYLAEACERASGIFETISSDAEALGDNMIAHSSNIAISEMNSLNDVVPTDWAETVAEAFNAYGVPCEYGRAMLLSDSRGVSYSLCSVSDEAQAAVLNGVRSRPEFASAEKVILCARNFSAPQPIIWVDDEGKVRLNHIVPAAASQFFGEQAVPSMNLFDSALWICDCLHIDYTGITTINELWTLIYSSVLSADYAESLSLTISAKVHGVAEHYVLIDTTIHGQVQQICTYVDRLAQHISNHFTTFWDLVKDNLENLGINRTLVALIDMIRSETKDMASFIATIQAKTQAMKDVMLGAVNAWNTGGYSGLASYILSFYDTARSMTDDNGLLVFTNNSEFIPQQYIAGVVATAVQITASVVGAIISACGYAIGLALIPLGELAAGLIRSIEYDEDQTRAAIQTDVSALSSLAPWAVFQQEVVYYYESNRTKRIRYQVLYDLLESDSASAYIVEVPGGYILIGRGKDEITETSVQKKCRLEFHPYCGDCIDVAKAISEKYCATFINWKTSIHFGISTTLNVDANAHTVIESLWEDAVDQPSFSNTDDNVLSQTEDKRMQRAICGNIFIFLIWLKACHGPDVITYSTKDSMYRLGVLSSEQPVNEDTDFTDNTSAMASWLSLTNPFGGVSEGGLFTDDFMLLSMNSWKPLGDGAVAWTHFSGDGVSNPSQAIEVYGYFGAVLPVTGDATWGLVPAKYDSATFWTYVVLTVAAGVVAVAATVAATVAITKWRRKKANMNRINAERAYDKCKADPSPENIQAYNKAVTKNNLMSSITGGSKINRSDYWGTTDSPSDESSGGQDQNVFSRVFGSPETESYRDGSAMTPSTDRFSEILFRLVGSVD